MSNSFVPEYFRPLTNYAIKNFNVKRFEARISAGVQQGDTVKHLVWVLTLGQIITKTF